MIKGVNLGNWLVLEKWMSPGLFAGTEAEDETQLSCDLADIAERLTAHRDSYITERDFAYLARHGIDLHTVPDSQNGFDNGGMCGVCKWHKNPVHVEFALTVLEQLTSRYRTRTALWGIEVLNEPISEQLWEAIDLPHRYPPRDAEYARGSEPVPTVFLKDFYTAAYRRIREQSDDVTIVFHDGFRMREWDGFFTNPEFERIVVDTHLYLMEYTLRTGDGDLREYLRHIRNEFGPTVREMSREFPLIVGEWCLEPMSAKAAAMPQDGRLDFYRGLADAQLAAWDGTVGWFFWSYKLAVDGSNLDGWDLRKSIELGYLPEPFSR